MRRVANRRTAAHDCDAAPKNVCAVRRVKTAMYCPRVGDCSKQKGKIVYAWNCMHYFFCLEVRLDGKTRATKAV